MGKILDPTVNDIMLRSLGSCRDSEVDVREGDLHIMRYKPIAHLVRTSQIVLI